MSRLVSVLVLLVAAGQAWADDRQLQSALKDEHAVGADHWIYNDLGKAIAEAKASNKPIFVTFRCVPCKACSGFDAEVAKGSEAITTLARSKFVALRQVEMKGVDLSQFQFDYDLNWAAMFINADGTVYGRYGTQSAKGPDAYNSVASLEKAMQRVLKLHEGYPANKGELEGKRGEAKPYKTALEMPALEDRQKLAGPTARNNCIHCHNIHDAENEHARLQGRMSEEFLWKYPLPDNLGMAIDPADGRKVQTVQGGSAAAVAGLLAGDEITHLNGQAMISTADIQWVLHNLPAGGADVKVKAVRGAEPVEKNLKLAGGWKKTDWSWRGSRWGLKPRPGFWSPELKPADLTKMGLPEGSKAMRIQWINTGQAEGRKAKEVGLKEGDVIVEIADKPVAMGPEQFHMHIRRNYKVGDELPITVMRDGKRMRFVLPLVD